MSGATTAPNDVGQYLRAVRAALADLPAEERDGWQTRGPDRA
jgi:hypothetical protein